MGEDVTLVPPRALGWRHRQEPRKGRRGRGAGAGAGAGAEVERENMITLLRLQFVTTDGQVWCPGSS